MTFTGILDTFRRCVAPRTTHLNVRETSGSRIPPEILTAIFHYLWFQTSDLQKCIARQAHLRSALLVCREWYLSGVHMLYSKLIIDELSLALLLPTLKRKPTLAIHVRTIVILERPLPPSKSFSESTRRQRVISSVLQSCKSLQSLVLHARCSFRVFLSAIRSSSQLQNLRRLAVCGSATSHHHIVARHVTLPQLEELTITSMVVGENTVWPSCPSLRRIRLEGCYFTDHLYRPTIPLPPSPLQQIDIYHCWTERGDSNISGSLYPFASSLEVLRINSTRIASPMHLFDFSHFTRVKHLSLFIDTPQFSLTTLPRSVALMPQLEELVVTCFWDKYELYSPWDVVKDLENLCQDDMHLEKMPFPVLRELVLQVAPFWGKRSTDGRDTDQKLRSDILQRFCDLRAIHLQLGERGDLVDSVTSFAGPQRWLRVLGLEGMLMDDC
ncbi:hypothetical protein JAAARDRAFT_525723 [Jaapia argillacea MUCL 33604]|uniref:Uncharacterized protein n=1 Tax=Jaapia argillacea MUCL 33604 TaxID=933084 RepID=A0A067Q4I4_9AGAM|nr:hypothetical protein JAAARDRAFT_525723 [Jaapia argillacea MUCL 33604]